MIKNERDRTISLSCDQCGRVVRGFETFREAIAFVKDEDWVAIKDDNEGVWYHFCNHCEAT